MLIQQQVKIPLDLTIQYLLLLLDLAQEMRLLNFRL